MMHPDVHAQARPDDPAYIMLSTNDTVTWSELRDRSQQGAQLLKRSAAEGGFGLDLGDGFAVLLDNHPRFLELMWVSQRSGLYVTPMSWHLTASEAEYIVRDSGAKVLFVSAAFQSLATELAARLDGSVKLVSVDSPFDDYVAYEPQRDAMPARPRDDETFGDDMLYTSGTTGRPKGVRRQLSGNPITEFPAHYAKWAAALAYTDRSVHYAAGPLYHASPLHTAMIGMTFGGCVIVNDKFEAQEALRIIQDYKVTIPIGYQRILFVSCLPEEVRRGYDLSSLQLVLHGAAPCPIWVKEQMIEWLGPIVVEYYGGSEGLGGMVINTRDWLAHWGSVGKPTAVPVHILDENTLQELPAGEIGLIYFEPMTKMEYHNDPENCWDYVPQGWGTLGDMGYLDADGYLYLADRRADLIITGGVNVYPREVEDRLLAHPQVVDAAVFGIRMTIGGKRPCCCAASRGSRRRRHDPAGTGRLLQAGIIEAQMPA